MTDTDSARREQQQMLHLHSQELAVLAQLERSTRVVQDRRIEL